MAALAVIVVCGFTALAWTNTSIAQATAMLYLSPASGSYNHSTLFTLNVYVNSAGQPTNAVTAELNYNTSLLDFVSQDSSSSSFGIQASQSGGGGTVKFERGSITPLTGSALLVGKVTFKSKTTAGAAAVSFTGNSAVVNSSTFQNILGSTAGGNYTVTNPPAPPPPPPVAPGPSPTPPAPPSPGTPPPSNSPTPPPAASTDSRPPDSNMGTSAPAEQSPDSSNAATISLGAKIALVVLTAVGASVVMAYRYRRLPILRSSFSKVNKTATSNSAPSATIEPAVHISNMPAGSTIHPAKNGSNNMSNTGSHRQTLAELEKQVHKGELTSDDIARLTRRKP